MRVVRSSGGATSGLVRFPRFEGAGTLFASTGRVNGGYQYVNRVFRLDTVTGRSNSADFVETQLPLWVIGYEPLVNRSAELLPSYMGLFVCSRRHPKYGFVLDDFEALAKKSAAVGDQIFYVE